MALDKMCLYDWKLKTKIKKNQTAGIIPGTAIFVLHRVMLLVYQFILLPAKLSGVHIIQNLLWYHIITPKFSMCHVLFLVQRNRFLGNIESKPDSKCKPWLKYLIKKCSVYICQSWAISSTQSYEHERNQNTNKLIMILHCFLTRRVPHNWCINDDVTPLERLPHY